MHKTWLVVRTAAVAACLILLAGVAFGADAVRIAYVDMDRVSEKAQFVRDLMADLEKSLNAKRSDLETKQEQYARLRRELEQRRAVLKESEIESRLRESRKLRGEIEQLDYEINRMFRRAEKQQMGPALDKILKTIRTVGAEEKFDLVLRGEIVVYGKPALNITEKVIARLDRDYAAGKIKIDASAAAAKTSPKARVDSDRALRKDSGKARRPAVSDDEARARGTEKSGR